MRAAVSTDVQSVRRWSRLTADGCLVLATVFVLATLFRWFSITEAALETDLGLSGVELTETRRIVCLMLALIPAALNAYALMRLRGSFQSFAVGDLFTRSAIMGLRDFAGGAVAAVVAATLISPLISVALTVGGSAGLQVDFDLGSTSLTILLISGVTWVFAHVLIRGAALAEENAALSRENAAFV